ncbi:MAG TPA: ADP-ribosylation factor-like protein, partial [Kofleriaceae bacterium]|nr:ADP-ribosylation factor-like protein [Kofleriaceae bacterium]
MPIVDRRTNSVVLRIVYDGPPEAGKTTNLRALCQRLSLSRRGELESPGGGERTQYFDWLDITGGWVGGHRVRCQLVTVPGQILLARRRRHILDSADVVVFVADSRASAAPETSAALRSLARGLDSRADVPLVLQANKQDLPDAQPPEQLHAALGLAARVPVIGAQASGGTGVLESFMLAVRLAVDHVRALLVAGELGEGEASGAAELLRALEADALPAADV